MLFSEICLPSIFKIFLFHPSTQEIAKIAHIFESSSWGLYQTQPLYPQLWDICIAFSLCTDITCSRTCLSLASTLTAWSFTLRHSPTASLSSKNTPFSRTIQRPVHPLGFVQHQETQWTFAAEFPGCVFRRWEIKAYAYLKWQRRAVPLEARSECFLLSWMEDLFELWQS